MTSAELSSSNQMPHAASQAPIIISAGEPAGIGPDLVIEYAQAYHQQANGIPSNPWLVIGDPNLFRDRAKQLAIDIDIVTTSPEECTELFTRSTALLPILPMHLATPAIAGQLNPDNSQYVIDTLTKATKLCQYGRCSALVTAPVHKGIINEAQMQSSSKMGSKVSTLKDAQIGAHISASVDPEDQDKHQAPSFFSGHTELLAELTGTKQVVMMLATGQFRVALATTHLPLREVPDAITQPLVESVIEIAHQDLIKKFGLKDPIIRVCGLNPHAGEQGYLGQEEIEIIDPAIKAMQAKGLRVEGSYPADTLFTQAFLDKTDLFLAMYHDQGLPVLKNAGFGNAVNITLGLPIVRTSVDHGTALTLAGTGKANMGSFAEAMRIAAEMVRHY